MSFKEQNFHFDEVQFIDLFSCSLYLRIFASQWLLKVSPMISSRNVIDLGFKLVV